MARSIGLDVLSILFFKKCTNRQAHKHTHIEKNVGEFEKK